MPRSAYLSTVLARPPHVAWKLGPSKMYAAFLSHYKEQAGMEARYLRDLLQKMLRQQIYLDSQNLLNLNDLFVRGIARSDTLVLLATKDVFMRPYCLLELWCAQRVGVPIVVLEVAGRHFEWATAHRICTDIAAALDADAVELIQDTLVSLTREIGDEGEQPPTLAQFGKQLIDAMHMDARMEPTAAAVPLERWGSLGGIEGMPKEEDDVSQVVFHSCTPLPAPSLEASCLTRACG